MFVNKWPIELKMCFMCTYVQILYCALFYWYRFAVVGQISVLLINNKDSVFWRRKNIYTFVLVKKQQLLFMSSETHARISSSYANDECRVTRRAEINHRPAHLYYGSTISSIVEFSRPQWRVFLPSMQAPSKNDITGLANTPRQKNNVIKTPFQT